jgi:hypothetical protein
MRPATPTARKYAQSLIALEGEVNKSAGQERPLGLDVCERLRTHLAMLLGTYGYQAIVARALRLASVEVKWLITLRILPTGAWEVPEQLDTRITADQLAEGNLLLVAHLLGLLITLMGEDVTLRQIQGIWPNQRLDDGAGDNGQIL